MGLGEKWSLEEKGNKDALSWPRSERKTHNPKPCWFEVVSVWDISVSRIPFFSLQIASQTPRNRKHGSVQQLLVSPKHRSFMTYHLRITYDKEFRGLMVMCYHSVMASCKPDLMPSILSGRSIGAQVIKTDFKAWLNHLISLMPGRYKMVRPQPV